MMHRIKFATLFASLIALVGTLCVPLTAGACTASTIANSYGFRFSGFVTSPTPVPLKVSAFFPEAAAGEISFTATSDSGGSLKGSESTNLGGVVLRLTFTGSYTLNTVNTTPQCTGSLTRTLSNGLTVSDDFVIVDGGGEIEFVSTSVGITEEGVMKKE